MKVLKTLKKAGIVVALSATMTLVVPVVAPANASVVTVEAATAKLSKKQLELVIGETKTLKVTGTKESVKWSSSDKKVATVSNKGKVKAVGMGTAKITAKVGKKKLTCTVAVAPFKGENITLENGTKLIIPKDWIRQEVNQNEVDMLTIAPTNNSSSSISIRSLTVEEILRDKDVFISQIKKVVTKESQETALENALKFDLTTSVFEQDEIEDKDTVGVSTYIEYTSDSQPVLQACVFDILYGDKLYEVVSYNFYDTDIDYIDYSAYIAASME